MSHGAKVDRASPAGNRNASLLISDPRAIRHTIGNSRAGEKPCVYFGVTAASSIIAPAAFEPALAACPATSSTDAAAILASPATSSSNAIKPLT